MRLETIKSQGLAQTSYYLSDRGEAAVIDPRRDIHDYIELAKEDCAEILYAFETHRNEDYVIGSLELKDVTGAEICHSGETRFGYGDHDLADGDTFRVGRLRVECLHTPGHTRDSICYAVHNSPRGGPFMVFTGDTLFVGDVGRTDLPGLDTWEEMSGLLHDSLHGKLLPLGDSVIVYPSHTAGSICGSHIGARDVTTIGYESRTNPQLSLDREEFIRERMGTHMLRPPYFGRMEEWNLNGPPLLKDAPVPRLLLPDSFEEEREKPNGVVVDTRQSDAFAGSHIPGSISIWLGYMAYFPGWILGYDQRLLLVNERKEDASTAIRYLHRIGFDDIVGYLCPGIGAWRNMGKPIETLGSLSVDEFREVTEKGGVTVLDVREDGEWDREHVEGAMHVYVGHLKNRLQEVPKDRPVVAVCASGRRSSIAASILKAEGYDVSNVQGGMNAWYSRRYPLSREP
jgi:hydroxyacylglutathione hydrolase